MIDGPEGAGFDYTVQQVQQVEALLAPHVGPDKPIVRANPRVPGGWGSSEEMHTGRVSVFLQPWRQRGEDTADVADQLQKELDTLSGVRVRAQVGGGLVRSGGQPFQIVLGGPEYAEIAQWRDRILLRMADNPGLVGVDSDYKETRPQMRVNIDRQRAADLGVSVTEVGSALETMMGSRRVTTFVDNGEELPQHAQVSWKGESREYQSSGGAVLLTFAMALLVVYLVLAAQFESFIHPLTIMLTVPLGVLGALVGLWVSGGTVNLFSQIGIVMLVGLAAKNGILIVEFANQLRDEGRTVREAIIESARVRLRPILMTSIATVVGAIPLVVAGGPGSASRGTIGVVIIFGVTLSTFLSLFVVPAFYARLAPYTRSPEAVARELEKQERESPSVGGHA
jgi:multidrug efflux pump subunit AcrB